MQTQTESLGLYVHGPALIVSTTFMATMGNLALLLGLRGGGSGIKVALDI